MQCQLSGSFASEMLQASLDRWIMLQEGNIRKHLSIALISPVSGNIAKLILAHPWSSPCSSFLIWPVWIRQSNQNCPSVVASQYSMVCLSETWKRWTVPWQNCKERTYDDVLDLFLDTFACHPELACLLPLEAATAYSNLSSSEALPCQLAKPGCLICLNQNAKVGAWQTVLRRLTKFRSPDSLPHSKTFNCDVSCFIHFHVTHSLSSSLSAIKISPFLGEVIIKADSIRWPSYQALHKEIDIQRISSDTGWLQNVAPTEVHEDAQVGLTCINIMEVFHVKDTSGNFERTCKSYQKFMIHNSAW